MPSDVDRITNFNTRYARHIGLKTYFCSVNNLKRLDYEKDENQNMVGGNAHVALQLRGLCL